VLILLSYAGKYLNFISSFFGYILYSVYLFVPPVYVTINLSSIHQNVMFTSEKVYFLNGTAYDFYSIDELNNYSGAGLQWKIFPLPNEPLSSSITPWTPNHHRQIETSSVYLSTPSETSTGLAFVDHIYITSTPKLIDRQANLERMFARYQITNYEWRMKWTQDNCYALENREEIYRKINLQTKSISTSSYSIIIQSIMHIFQIIKSKDDNVQLQWNILIYGMTSSLVIHRYLLFSKTMLFSSPTFQKNSTEQSIQLFEQVYLKSVDYLSV
jgi:hypothetical protein